MKYVNLFYLPVDGDDASSDAGVRCNMASFANMLPRVHIHVMARFENDSYFPNPMWGEKLRDADLNLADEEKFHKRVFNALTASQSND